jgi:hypothetical protein
VSIEVALADLAGRLDGFPWGFLLTVDDGQHARLLAVPTRFVDGALSIDAGPGSRANATSRPEVTVVFPPRDGTEMSLVVDGLATVDGEQLVVTPTHAVMHRPAIR